MDASWLLDAGARNPIGNHNHLALDVEGGSLWRRSTRGHDLNHEYLIDGEGRRWCADDCPAEPPHWTGEFETVYEIPPGLEGESGSGNARRSEKGNSVPATPLQAWVRTKNGRVWVSKDGLSWIDLGPVELNVLVPVAIHDEDDVTWSDISTPSPEYVVYDDKAHPFTITEEK
jgi:hypothetical protein